MKITPIAEPRVTLISRPSVTKAGRIRMLEFYGKAAQERDHFPMPQEVLEFAGRVCYDADGRKNLATASSEGYLGNILDQRHYSVLEHGSYTFFLEGISRTASHELVRHRHGSYSQQSQRYVLATKDPAVVLPPAIADELTDSEFSAVQSGDADSWGLRVDAFVETHSHAFETYRVEYEALRHRGLDRKQASEAARNYLPNAAATDIVVTMNIRSLIEFFEKRIAPGADAEIRRVAEFMLEIMEGEVPEIFDEKARESWSGANEQKAVK